MNKYRAIILTVRKSLELNLTTIYRWAFLGEVADSITQTGIWQVEIFDGAVLDAYFDDYITILKKKYDLILFYTDPHTAHEVKTICEYAKVISPTTKTLIYGRATAFIPHYFERDPFDAVHIDGDRELILRDYALYLSKKINLEDLTGLSINQHGVFSRLPNGKRLIGNSWYFPLLDLLPINAYKEIYRKKKRTFEYAITVSKGCEYNCKYCEASIDQGLIDRRRDPDEVIRWINSKIIDKDEWNIQLWSSNFFTNKEWINQFCDVYTKHNSLFNWRCVGNFRDIDESSIERISKSGCYEIAIGAETLFYKSTKTLKGSKDKLVSVIELGRKYNINIKCLLMAGIPNQTNDDIIYTVRTLLDMGVPIRYTLYTPLDELKLKSVNDLDNTNLSLYDRRTFIRDIDNPSKEVLILALTQNWDSLFGL